jgi:hypothetical protein
LPGPDIAHDAAQGIRGPEDLKKRIAEAFMRDAQVDANWIRVEVHDDEWR